ncbi:hypothetical protein M2161_000738 [Streptomyces sp. SAI-133]|uniref:hypothetical protein n=1 Tax=unclassified Streptomyces TaxID=2593676 RepID=UPI00247487D8|nr:MULTISPECIES: hypothetical protein [unclassified Streptomyces]MDH6581632.1 hypothetical protein [Streptomyces sp. SAI-133]
MPPQVASTSARPRETYDRSQDARLSTPAGIYLVKAKLKSSIRDGLDAQGLMAAAGHFNAPTAGEVTSGGPTMIRIVEDGSSTDHAGAGMWVLASFGAPHTFAT